MIQYTYKILYINCKIRGIRITRIDKFSVFNNLSRVSYIHKGNEKNAGGFKRYRPSTGNACLQYWTQ